MTPKSVKKKLKQPSFAAGVNRDEVRQGAEELGVDFDEHVAFVIDGDGGARRRARARSSRRDRRLRRGLEDPHRPARRAGRAAGRQHARRRQRDQGRRGDGRRRPDPQPSRRRPPGHRHRPPVVAASRRADRAHPLLRRARCTGGTRWSRCSPRDHRVIRIDLLGHGGSAKPKSGYSIADQGAPRRRGARPARRPGRGRRRPLAGRRRRRLGRRAGERARRPRS